MTPEFVLTRGQEALTLLLMVSLPLLLVVLVVGLVVSIVQTITQIHEATLSFVPKLVAALLMLALAGPWIITTLVDYIRRTIESIPTLVQ